MAASSASGSGRASSTASAATRKDAVPRFGVMWSIMRSVGDMSLPFFFSSVSVLSSHLVPPSTTPLILCSNHSNTILDVAILASHFPERRPLHFWAKAGFFKNPITRFILTSSGNIKVDRRNKNNQTLFEGTFEAMKAGGAIALFPEGGSYTIPKLAKLKMGAAWAALEYSRYLQLQGGDKRPETEVNIVPAAVVMDDKSVFRSRAVLRFGKPIRLDSYIDEFLSAPPPAGEGVRADDTTVPPTPETMTRTNSAAEPQEDKHASPAHRAVARLTADLQRAMEELTFNADSWETFQAVRAARELIFELGPEGELVKDDMEEYVRLSRDLMTLLTLDSFSATSTDNEQVKANSRSARQALFAYSSLLHLCDVDHITLARSLRQPPRSGLWSSVKSFALRLPLYIPIFGPTLIPTYLLPNALAHHYAGREEESLSSVKTLFSFFFTSILYTTLVIKTMQWSRWSPPGLLVGLAGVWFLHDLNRSNIDTAYGLVKQIRFGWRLSRSGVNPSAAKAGGVKKEDENVEEEGKSLFFYGTLVHPKILARVIGNQGAHLRVQNAVLDGAKLLHVKKEEYPGLILDPSACVKGTLVSGLTDSDVKCLDAFEGDEYTRTSVNVIPDPACRIESNSIRIANAGTAPLHSILASLTKPRMELLRATGQPRGNVEVYRWTAGEHRLEKDKVWEFDVFAREKAQNWVRERGMEEVEHEHEYQVVDAIRSDAIPTNTRTPPEASTPTKEADEDEKWIGELSWLFVPGAQTAATNMREVIVTVVKQLREKPSIQYYVDKAFPKERKIRRPKLDNPLLLTALFAARAHAQSSVEQLLAAVGDGKVQPEAVSSLVIAKTRALSKVGVSAESGIMWPFTSAQVSDAEDRKNI